MGLRHETTYNCEGVSSYQASLLAHGPRPLISLCWFLVGLGWWAKTIVQQAHEVCGLGTLVECTWDCDDNRKNWYQFKMQITGVLTMVRHGWWDGMFVLSGFMVTIM